MPRKKLDSRIRSLIDNAVKQRQRALFVVVGDRGREQIVNLHYMLSKAAVRARPTVLWCYKKHLGFNTTAVALRSSDPRQAKKRGRKGPKAGGSAAFDDFVSSTDIRYCFYKETHRVLGQTFGMLVLQDFEALTPNLLARTVETVQGGGIVVLLLHTMDSLRQLHALAMDAHKRFRPTSEALGEPVARFNERFLLSLAACDACLVVDDELNVLPISSKIRNASGTPSVTEIDTDGFYDVDDEEKGEEGTSRGAQIFVTQETKELRDLKASLRDVQPAGPLVSVAGTVDQARAAMILLDAIAEKTLTTTVSITAARGRGKSAALGLAVAGAVATGYSNIFITAPAAENVKTLFAFVLRGLDALGFREHADYDIVQAQNAELGKAVVRLNIFRAHRQTVQYIAPQDYVKLEQAELLVVDEAAAIPLPIVQRLLGNYLVFLSSTVNGYEGTGRSLSLKLISKLREQSAATSSGKASHTSGRTLREVELKEPIRYAAGDPIEKWLNGLLCLDAASDNALPPLQNGYPPLDRCSLYYVNRDTLFSYHETSEKFLQRIWSLFVSAHYKNSPNDLQLLSDAPAHHLFVLLGPIKSLGSIPDVLACIHVAFEGAISRESVVMAMGRGEKAPGDLIPWTVSQQFQDTDFPSLSGARVVRIATHPSAQGMGYGLKALQLLASYYNGEMASVDEKYVEAPFTSLHPQESQTSGDVLHTETIKPREGLPPLLIGVDKRRPERLHWLGVAFGLSAPLYRFWSRSGYEPVYVRLTENEITGEHSCIMLRRLSSSIGVSESDDNKTVIGTDSSWLDRFSADFRSRFCTLLSYDLRSLPVSLATSVLIPDIVTALKDSGLCVPVPSISQKAGSDIVLLDYAERRGRPLGVREVRELYTLYDLGRLRSYVKNLAEFREILDLVPLLCRLIFTGRVPVGFSVQQYCILVGLALQRKTIDVIAKEISLEPNQVLANFHKALIKTSAWLDKVIERSVEQELALPDAKTTSQLAAGPIDMASRTTMEEDLQEAGKQSLRRLESQGTKPSSKDTPLGRLSLDKKDDGMNDDDDDDDDDMVERDDDKDDGRDEISKQEKLARRLGVSWYKCNNGDLLDEAAAKLRGKIPNIVSFKVGTKDIDKKTKKNQALFHNGAGKKHHSGAGKRKH